MILSTEMLSSLEIIGSNIREIEFSFCFIPTLNILINFPKVEKITISACIFQNQFANDLKLEHINKLELNYDIDGEHDDFSQFLSIFPNLTDITFTDQIPFETFSRLPKLCISSTSLSLRLCLLPGNYRNVKFLALKKFHLEIVDGGNNWSDLVMSNPTIETLSFKTISINWVFNADKLIKVFELLPNMMHLKLGGAMKEKLNLFQNMKKSIKISLT